MNYLITAAGLGSRYLKEGIKPPKPLIKVKGMELLLWSLKSFDFKSSADNEEFMKENLNECRGLLFHLNKKPRPSFEGLINCVFPISPIKFVFP